MAWLSGWSYRKEITITGQSGAGTNYQIDLDIGDSAGGDFHLEGHCTNFPQDIAVTDNDETTPIDYWIEDISADPLKMWVEVVDDLGSNQTIYVYYGKSGATTDSNGANTFLQYHGSASSDYLDSLVTPASSSLYYRTKFKNSGTPSNVIFGIANTNDVTDDTIYLQSYTGTDLRYVNAANEGTYGGLEEAPDLSTDTYYIGEMKFLTGSSLYGYIDGDEISSGGVSSNLPNEAMGLWLWEISGIFTQDWALIAKYNSPEPAFSSAGSEETPPTGVSPTSVFYGPLVGPLGGPI